MIVHSLGQNPGVTASAVSASARIHNLDVCVRLLSTQDAGASASRRPLSMLPEQLTCSSAAAGPLAWNKRAVESTLCALLAQNRKKTFA